MNSVETARLSETAPIAVRTLDHVTVVVGDLEASRTFYVDVLGMQEVPRPAFSFDGLWFQSGPTQIHLILEHDGSGPAGNLVPSEQRGARTHHFAFQVDDAHACAIISHTHTIVVESDSARFTMSIENVPSEENPGTGKITALSVIAALRGLVAPLRVGT